MKKGVSKIASSVFCFQNPNLLPSFFYSYYLYQMTLQITRHNTYNLKARSQQFPITTSYDLRMIHYFLVPFPTKTSYQAGIVFFIWSFYFFPSHINNIYGAELSRSNLWVDRLTTNELNSYQNNWLFVQQSVISLFCVHCVVMAFIWHLEKVVP